MVLHAACLRSIVAGPGRMAVFTQGCRHACPGCHNPESHDFAGGHVESVAALVERMRANPLLDGLTLTGGDPFEQCAPCRALAEGARALGLTVWAYTGYTWDQLMAQGGLRALAEVCDVVVDGRFELNERTLELRFRGSRNQLRAFPGVIRMMERRERPFLDLVTRVYPLAETGQALADWNAAPASVSKILIDVTA